MTSHHRMRRAAVPAALAGIAVLTMGAKGCGSTSSTSTGTVTTASTAPAGEGTLAPATTAAAPTTAPATAPATTPATTAAPTTVNRLPHDKDFEVQSLTLKADYSNDFSGTARLTNTGAQPYTATFKFTILQPGTQNVVATLEGSADGVAAGQTVTVQLISQDAYRAGYTSYQFEVDAEF